MSGSHHLLLAYTIGAGLTFIPCAIAWVQDRRKAAARARKFNARAIAAGRDPIYSIDWDLKHLAGAAGISLLWFALGLLASWETLIDSLQED